MTRNPDRCSLRSFDITRAQTIALNVEFAPFGSKILGQHFQSAFGCCVGTHRFTPEFAHHRADIDDFAMSLFDHTRYKRL